MQTLDFSIARSTRTQWYIRWCHLHKNSFQDLGGVDYTVEGE